MAVKLRSMGSGASGGWFCAPLPSPDARTLKSCRSRSWPVETNAHLLRFDSVHGRFPHEVGVDGDSLVVNGQKIKVTAIKDPTQLPHKALGVDIALECTGIFSARDKAAMHLTAGAKRVLVSAPSDGADLTVVYGVNHGKLTKEHLVFPMRLAPPTVWRRGQGAQRHVGIERGFMTTIHSYTGDQPTLDTLHKDSIAPAPPRCR